MELCDYVCRGLLAAGEAAQRNRAETRIFLSTHVLGHLLSRLRRSAGLKSNANIYLRLHLVLTGINMVVARKQA